MAAFALSGSGAMAAVWAELIASAGHELRAVTSRQPGRAAQFAAPHGADPAPAGTFLAGVDVVVVASAPPDHAADAQGAAQGPHGAGRRPTVVVEAPLCATLADADRLVGAAEAGADIVCAENLLHAPLVRDAVQRARDLGPPSYLGGRVVQRRPRRHHRLDARWGGGVLFDSGPHALAVLLALAGTDRPVSVSAELTDRHGGEPPLDDHAVLSLTFASGATARLELAWDDAGPPQWDLQLATARSALRLELLPDPHLEQLGVDLPRPPRRWPEAQPEQLELFGYLDQLHELVADRAANRPSLVTVTFGRHVLDIICAAYLSAGTTSPQTLPFTGDRSRTPWQLWRSG